MDNKEFIEDDEIDLKRIFEIGIQNILLFVAICFVCCTGAFLITKFAMDEEFTATAKLIVVQKDDSSSQSSYTYSDVQLSQKLVNTYSEIIMSEAISDDVIQELDLYTKYEIDTEKYNDIVSVSSANSTEVINIDVTTTDPKLSADIANQIVTTFEEKIYEIMQIENVTSLTRAKVPEKKSGPSTVKNVAIGGALGFMICCCIILYLYFKDNKIKTEEELKKIFDYPIIGTIPEIEINNKEVSQDGDKK